MAFVKIETSRLILRTVTPQDRDKVASAWKPDQKILSSQEAARTIQWMLDNHRLIKPGHIVHLCLAIIEKETREWIGWCGLDHRDHDREHPVLFYLLIESRWGRGLGTEAARAVLDHAFRELRLPRVDSSAASDNIASIRIMEKIGMRFQGRSENGDFCFTVTREEYVSDHPTR